MKKIYLLLLFTIFTISSTFSQSYIPFLNNTSWNINISSFGYNQNMWIVPKTDTVIGSFTYKRFMDSAYNAVVTIYEDVASKKVYRLIGNSNVLLCDFSLLVNSTITLSNGLLYVVNSIDSINLATGGKTRRFHLVHNSGGGLGTSETWIEGVGNNDHPLKPFFELPSDPAYHINCSYQNGINFYNFGLANGASSTNCPAPLLSIKEINNSVHPIKISPNPFATETTLQIDKMLIGSTLTIFNISGQQIKQIKNITDETIILYRYDLQSGFYYIQLTKDNKSYNSKIVITDN